MLQTLLSEDNELDSNTVASISDGQPTPSADSCPAVNSSPQYVIDTETGIKHYSCLLSCLSVVCTT